jgi:hypothetical protein
MLRWCGRVEVSPVVFRAHPRPTAHVLSPHNSPSRLSSLSIVWTADNNRRQTFLLWPKRHPPMIDGLITAGARLV